MKYITTIFLCLILLSANAQESAPIDYRDSTITITAPRCFAWWVTKSIYNGLNRENFRMVDVLKPYVSDSTKPDSLFTVTLKAKYIENALELLIQSRTEVGLVDRLKIINNQKVGATGAAIVGYTALQNQIVSKANGNSSEKNTAIYLRDWFLGRQAALKAVYNEERNDVIKLVNHQHGKD